MKKTFTFSRSEKDNWLEKLSKLNRAAFNTVAINKKKDKNFYIMIRDADDEQIKEIEEIYERATRSN